MFYPGINRLDEYMQIFSVLLLCVIVN